MGKKYCFVGEPVIVKSRFVHSSVTYHRIMAAKNIISPDGKLIAAKGDLGGLVEDESNLEHEVNTYDSFISYWNCYILFCK